MEKTKGKVVLSIPFRALSWDSCKDFKCGKCKRWFYTNTGLKIHRSKKHHK